MHHLQKIHWHCTATPSFCDLFWATSAKSCITSPWTDFTMSVIHCVKTIIQVLLLSFSVILTLSCRIDAQNCIRCMASSMPLWSLRWWWWLKNRYNRHENNSNQTDPTLKPCITGQLGTLPAHIGIFIEADQRWKQLQSENQQQKQKFYGLSPLSPTPSITTIQQSGLGIVHAFSTLLINPLKSLFTLQLLLPLTITITFYPVTKLSVYC
jgi:hypothetical protein